MMPCFSPTAFFSKCCLNSSVMLLLIVLQKGLERTSKGFSKSPVQEIDEYFELVAKLGRPLFKWDIIRCAFLWKLEVLPCVL